MNLNEYVRLDYAIKVFNILNYTETLERLMKQKDKVQLEHYRLRLNGHLDLFSF